MCDEMDAKTQAAIEETKEGFQSRISRFIPLDYIPDAERPNFIKWKCLSEVKEFQIERLKREAHRFGFISVDTESIIGFGYAKLQIGTTDGTAFVWSKKMKCNCGTSKPCPMNWRRELPPGVIEVLTDRTIIKAGSDMRQDYKKDFLPHGLEDFVPIVDYQDVFDAYRGLWREEKFAEGKKKPTGFGRISYLLYGFSYKLYNSAQAYIKKYEGLDPNVKPPYLKWPKHRTWRLFSWKGGQWEKFEDAYLRGDSLIGNVLVCFIGLNTSSPELLAKGMKAVCLSVLEPFVEDPTPLNPSQVDALLYSDISDNEEPESENVNTSLPDSSNMKISIQEEDDALIINVGLDDIVDADPQPSTSTQEPSVPLGSKLTKCFRKRRTCKPHDDPSLWRSIRVEDRCLFCGSTEHGKYHKFTGKKQCPELLKKKDETAASCTYKWCGNKASHCTPMCQALQSRCRKCGRRGHFVDDCSSTPAAVAQFLADFEKFADQGVRSCLRFENLIWGFHAIPSGMRKENIVPLNQLIDYKTLLKAKDVESAEKLLTVTVKRIMKFKIGPLSIE